jgi:hypothetical protein
MEAFQALPILQTPTKSFVLYSFEATLWFAHRLFPLVSIQ